MMMMVMMAVMMARSPALRHEGIVEPVEFARIYSVLLKTSMSVAVINSTLFRIGEDLDMIRGEMTVVI